MWFLIISIIVISILGTLAHFIYDLTNHNKIMGLFGAVNESTWEHIKIALTPTFLWGILDGFLYGTNPNYFLAKLTSVMAIIVIMPLLFYGHKYVAKKDYFIFDIISFYIVITCSQLFFYLIITMENLPYIINYLSCIGLFMAFGCYMTLTLLPMKNFIFKDPITKKYGYKAHSEESNIFKKSK